MLFQSGTVRYGTVRYSAFHFWKQGCQIWGWPWGFELCSPSSQPYTWGHLGGVWGAPLAHTVQHCGKKCIFLVRVWHLPYLEIRLPNLGVAMGAARCGALATLVAIGTLGAIWVGATRCQWPTKFDTSNQFAIFCHGQIAIFLPKKLE